MCESEFIKSCPFCGSIRVEIARTNKRACWVECADCSGRTDSDPSRDQAIGLWNKRPEEKPTRALIIDDMDKEYPV